ncbi:MAG: hypothetical protein M1547_09680 [Gammaproteobacteria bacterium]|nr:hypothetical protein [Gammaproteobacteria bacterium]
MIIHCSQKIAAKLADVSPVQLEETSPLGGWHAHLFTLDRRQCVMFCHDATRYTLFLPGLRKERFAELSGQWFRPLYLATFAAFGCPPAQISKAELAMGPIRFDTATDRSVQGSLRVARQDLEAWAMLENTFSPHSSQIAHRCQVLQSCINVWPDPTEGVFPCPTRTA